MNIFYFILILVLIISVTEMITKIGVPLAKRLADRTSDADLERLRDEVRAAAALPPEAMDELEQRLARIEDRLAFLEALKEPVETPRLSAGAREDEP